GERIGERAALVDRSAHLGHGRLEPDVLDLIDQRTERIGERNARLDQRRYLPRERGDLDLLDAAEQAAEVDVARQPALLCVALLGELAAARQLEAHHVDAVLAEHLAQDLGRLGVADSTDRLAGRAHTLECVHRHQSLASAVIRMTSSGVVIPRTTLRAPSNRSDTMPCSIAALRIAPASDFSRHSRRT